MLYKNSEFFWIIKDIFDLDIDFSDEVLVKFDPKKGIKDILISNKGNKTNLPFKSKIEVGNKKKSDEAHWGLFYKDRSIKKIYYNSNTNKSMW
jgi:hypothetical protein